MQLFNACAKNIYGRVEYELEKGTNINFRHSNNITPLMIACKRNHFNIVDLLLDNGADAYLVDINDHDASSYASAFKSFKSIEVLVSYGIDISEGLCYAPDKETIDFLLSHGANINGRFTNPINYNISNIEYLLQKGIDIKINMFETFPKRYLRKKTYEILIKYGVYFDMNYPRVYGIADFELQLQCGLFPMPQVLIDCARSNKIDSMKKYLDYDCVRLEPSNEYSNEMNDVLENYYPLPPPK